jgi:hypothetical protein
MLPATKIADALGAIAAGRGGMGTNRGRWALNMDPYAGLMAGKRYIKPL